MVSLFFDESDGELSAMSDQEFSNYLVRCRTVLANMNALGFVLRGRLPEAEQHIATLTDQQRHELANAAALLVELAET